MQRIANDLTLLIDTANAPIFGIDANGLVNEWNRKAAEITGYTKEEVIGQDLVRKFITAEFQESVNEVLQNALLGRETANFEFPLYKKPVHLTCFVLAGCGEGAVTVAPPHTES